MSRLPLIIGHRGASSHAPENTLAALKLALDHGADGVEFDVRLARDERPDLIVLDIMLPYRSGLEITSLLRREKAIPIILPPYGNLTIEVDKAPLAKPNGQYDLVKNGVRDMIEERKRANKIADVHKRALAYCDEIKEKYFEVIRDSVDKLELLVDNEDWPLVKYRELLFLR